MMFVYCLSNIVESYHNFMPSFSISNSIPFTRKGDQIFYASVTPSFLFACAFIHIHSIAFNSYSNQ